MGGVAPWGFGGGLGAGADGRGDRQDRPTDKSSYDITAPTAIGGYRLRLTFADGLVGAIDLESRLRDPIFEPLADPGFSDQVTVDLKRRTVMWPNGADLAPEVLHDQVAANVGSVA